jgi:quinoprotein glucose dehydrogenase
MRHYITTSLCALALATSFTQAQAQPNSINDGIYTLEQAAAGKQVYQRDCAVCHGAKLTGGEGGVALVGSTFLANWLGKPYAALDHKTRTTMPVVNPNGLSSKAYDQVLAFMLLSNGFPYGESDLAGGDADLKSLQVERPNGNVNGLQAELAQVAAPVETSAHNWTHVRGDAGSSNYSSLTTINADNVKQLKIAWRWKTANFGPTPEFYFQATPVMVDGVLYTTAGNTRTAVAIDAKTGETLWMHRYPEGKRGENAPRKGSGRGVAYGVVEDKARIYYITPGYRLIGLDANTGLPIPEFGNNGIVDLKKDLDQQLDLVNEGIGASSAPILVNGVIVVGAAFGPGGAPDSPKMISGHVRGYDAVTGKRRWIFHTIPQSGEEGNDTWLENSWIAAGNTGVWAQLSADPELDMVYLPVEAARGDYYGGHRPGDNLYSQSLLALNASTGTKAWHFQMIHHGIWDYDPPAPPLVFDINDARNGQGIKTPVVAQITKQGFIYAFDRRDGTPIWPIEERAVPQSTIETEWTSPTQPFPTKPKPFAPQGMTVSSLNDLTPEILAEAKRIAANYTMGPLYTPPTRFTETNKGTLLRPSAVGGANWPGGVVDHETGYLYVSASTYPFPVALGESDRSTMDLVGIRQGIEGPFGLPLTKPPFGTITAIDMNSGEHVWQIANADTPDEFVNHPKLAGVDLPRTGHDERVGLLVTASLLFAGEGSGLYVADGGGNIFRAHDKKTGAILWEFELPARQTGLPMTYAVDGEQFIVLPVGGEGHAGELVGLKLF